MLDQMVRNESGGEMLQLFLDERISHNDIICDHIFKRVGGKLPLSMMSAKKKASYLVELTKLKEKKVETYDI